MNRFFLLGDFRLRRLRATRTGLLDVQLRQNVREVQLEFLNGVTLCLLVLNYCSGNLALRRSQSLRLFLQFKVHKLGNMLLGLVKAVASRFGFLVFACVFEVEFSKKLGSVEGAVSELVVNVSALGLLEEALKRWFGLSGVQVRLAF